MVAGYWEGMVAGYWGSGWESGATPLLHTNLLVE